VDLDGRYKHARRWQDALRACDRAIALDPNDCEGPRWNAGIAAAATTPRGCQNAP
jgi:hypothetical protein